MTKPGQIEHVLLEDDDLMHEVEDVSNYNESAYYNFFDATDAVGGWVRIGNRVNEGYAEVSVCLYEPDGSAAFQYKRPSIEHNDAFAAGGLSFEVVEAWKHHRIAYEGSACFLTDPLDMAEPRDAFKANPQVPVSVDIDWFGRSEGWGGEPRRRTTDGGWEPANAGDPEKLAARGHFQQTGVVEGTIIVDGRRYQLEGNGHRDHSWGPRYWQNMSEYRWLTITLGPDFGLMGSVFLSQDDPDEARPHRTAGFVYRKGQPNVEIDRVELRTRVRRRGRVPAAHRRTPHRRRRRGLRRDGRRAVGGAVSQPTGRWGDPNRRRRHSLDLQRSHRLRDDRVPRPALEAGVDPSTIDPPPRSCCPPSPTCSRVTC
ncbi:MAG: hypothetical protein U5R31_17595 [Acidimicrobiia bacterium]|nr:hypothetical protein [Acidimicrobiia bacterium]